MLLTTYIKIANVTKLNNHFKVATKVLLLDVHRGGIYIEDVQLKIVVRWPDKDMFLNTYLTIINSITSSKNDNVKQNNLQTNIYHDKITVNLQIKTI